MARPSYDQNVLDALPGTAAQIADRAGLRLHTVHEIVARLRRRDLVHTSGWAPTVDFSRWIEVHARGPGIGPGLNAARPALLPEAPPGMRKRERRTCHCCGAEFDVFESDAAAGAGKFCSIPCKNMGAGPQAIVLDCLPGTSEEIAKRSGLEQKQAMQAMARLIAKNMAHYAGLVPAPEAKEGKKRRFFTMKYAAGPQPIPSMPAKMWDATARFYRKMISEVMPGTKKQIMTRTGIDPATVLKHVDAMHADGECHIKRWRKAPKKGHHMAVYEKGPGMDAPDTIKPLTMEERYIRFRSKPGRVEALRANQREYMRIRRIRLKKGDPLINALFGTPQQRKQAASTQGESNE